MKKYPYTTYNSAHDETIILGHFTQEEIYWLVNNLYDIPTDFYKETIDGILKGHGTIGVAPVHVSKLIELIEIIELRKNINNGIEKVLE